MNRIFGALLAVAVTLMLSSGACAQTLYKYLGPDGKTIYSDKPPPPGMKFEKIQPNTAPTGVDLRPRGTAATPQESDIDRQIRERQARQAEREQQLLRAQQDYDTALGALERAKVPRDGDRSMNANGTSRLSEDYLKRIEDAEQQVERTKQRLEEARRS